MLNNQMVVHIFGDGFSHLPLSMILTLPKTSILCRSSLPQLGRMRKSVPKVQDKSWITGLVFVGKILTRNHGFYMFLPWRSWGFPVPIFPLNQPSEWSEPCVRKYFGIWNWDVIIVLVYRALFFTSHPNSWAQKFWRHLQWFLLGFGFLSLLLIFLFLRWMSTPRCEDSETFGVSKASLKCHYLTPHYIDYIPTKSYQATLYSH